MRELTQAHKDAMLAGRKATTTARKQRRINAISVSELEEVKHACKYLPSVETAFRNAFSGTSKAAGIKAKCIQCSGYQKAEVSNCKVIACALFRYRPYQGGIDESEGEAGS
jgi:hypothetical protein